MPGKKAAEERKLQRGLSLTPSLDRRIRAEKDKYGMTWNETVERVLEAAFPATQDIPNTPETRRNGNGASAEAIEEPAWVASPLPKE